MSQLEWLAAALVLINVALVAMRKVWNYPFALAAVTLYAFVFYEAKLYSDMLLGDFLRPQSLRLAQLGPRARRQRRARGVDARPRSLAVGRRRCGGTGPVELGDAPLYRRRGAVDRRGHRDA